MQLPFSLPAKREFAAVGFGVNAVDYLIVVPHFPQFDTKVRLTEHLQAAGGQTASAMVGVQRLGMQTAYAGRFGSDREGAFGLESLRAEGVNVAACEVVENARTQVGYIIIDAGRGGERTVIWDRDALMAYAATEAPRDFARRGRVLHLDGHDPYACLVVAGEARRAGTIISADLDNVYDGCTELLPLIDVLITSKEFPQRLTGVADMRAALTEIKTRYGCPLVGVTLGAHGALLLCGESFLEVPAFAAPGGAKDTTGAGDAFHAGFIYGMLCSADDGGDGFNVETCARYGHAVAALKCRALGARTGLPTLAELTEFMPPPHSFNPKSG